MGILHTIPRTEGDYSEKQEKRTLENLFAFVVTLYLIALDAVVWNLVTWAYANIPNTSVLEWVSKIGITFLIILGIVAIWLPEKENNH